MIEKKINIINKIKVYIKIYKFKGKNKVSLTLMGTKSLKKVGPQAAQGWKINWC